MSLKDEARELVAWLLADARSQIQDEIAAYIQRGRRFEKKPLEQLNSAYMGGFKSWVSECAHNPFPADMIDAECELTLRGEALPGDELKAERETLLEDILTDLESGPENVARNLAEISSRLKDGESRN